nr:uncharacterized protein CLBA1 [Loxodonta africana]
MAAALFPEPSTLRSRCLSPLPWERRGELLHGELVPAPALLRIGDPRKRGPARRSRATGRAAGGGGALALRPLRRFRPARPVRRRRRRWGAAPVSAPKPRSADPLWAPPPPPRRAAWTLASGPSGPGPSPRSARRAPGSWLVEPRATSSRVPSGTHPCARRVAWELGRKPGRLRSPGGGAKEATLILGQRGHGRPSWGHHGPPRRCPADRARMWPPRAAPVQWCVRLLSTSSSGLSPPGGTKMQDPWQLARVPGPRHPFLGPQSHLKGGAGELSLREGPGTLSDGRLEGLGLPWDQLLPEGQAKLARSSEGSSARTCGCPDPGEHSSAWGEFEGFRESSPKSKQFSQSLGFLEKSSEPPLPRAASDQEEQGSLQPHQGGPDQTGNAAVIPSESIRSYEKIFKFAFQELLVGSSPEGVSTLNHCLEMNHEETADLGPTQEPFCPESRKLWRALQKPPDTSTFRGLWNESRCRDNFFLVLGIDAAQKSLSRGGGPGLEGLALTEPEEPQGVTPHWNPCSALIQTQLSGTPSHRQGALITCSLFLKKTPFLGHMQHLTSPRKKKLFTPHSLARMLFKSDVC